MTTKRTAHDHSAEKDPSTWVTGDEPLTGPQESYLETLAQQAGEEVPEDLTKAEASQMIEELQEKTGRGVHHDAKPAKKAAPRKKKTS